MSKYISSFGKVEIVPEGEKYVQVYFLEHRHSLDIIGICYNYPSRSMLSTTIKYSLDIIGTTNLHIYAQLIAISLF